MSKAVLGQIIDRLLTMNESEFRQSFLSQARQGKGLQMIFTPNPEQVVMAVDSEDFRQSILSADVLLADGAGLVLVARSRDRRVSRITGVDTLSWWLEHIQQLKIPTLLLGGRQGVAELVAKKSDPSQQWCFGIEGHVNVAAARNPAFSDQFMQEQKEIFAVIKQKGIKVLFVAFGAPWQEEFLCRHRSELAKAGVKVAMVCGGSFDYLGGLVRRAPAWIRVIGLEWLFRLITEPWRWRRQLRLIRFLRLL